MSSVDVNELSQDKRASRFLESSGLIRQRVCRAREVQQKRFVGTEQRSVRIYSNAEMGNKHIKKYCVLAPETEKILNQAAIAFHVSARYYFKLIKVARTIADLEGVKAIGSSHMAEALQYRQ